MTEYFMVLDTETTNSLDDPLTYDIGFAVVDRNGKVYETHSYAIADVFLDNDLMSSAYFIDKVPSYWEEIKKGQRELRRLVTVKFILADVIKQYGIKKVFAHNCRFDYLALNTTQRYLTSSKFRYFLPYGIEMCDTLKMSRDVLGKNENYISFCEENDFVTTYGKPRFTAEVIFRFLKNDVSFVEEHKGIDDVLIEKEILAYCLGEMF